VRTRFELAGWSDCAKSGLATGVPVRAPLWRAKWGGAGRLFRVPDSDFLDLVPRNPRPVGQTVANHTWLETIRALAHPPETRSMAVMTSRQPLRGMNTGKTSIVSVCPLLQVGV
jgi:hypothetical protein